jgi:hypothetical protein
MHKPNEDVLQFIWQNRLLNLTPFRSVSGKEIEILKPGTLNLDAGPDFFNGQVRINGVTLSGNIEIHVRTSDWLKHRHEKDKNYDHLILHVVFEHDVIIPQNSNNHVEVLEIKHFIAENVLQNYSKLSESPHSLPCQKQLTAVNDFKFMAWMERMTVERLQSKVAVIHSLFEVSGNDYLQTFYKLFLKSFGFKVNALPFELLAKHLPLSILLKHSDNLEQLEALLLGCAGMLEAQFKDSYIRKLQNEFAFLRTKYHLVPLQKEIFKYSKMRPANFPHLRLAQLAAIIHTNSQLVANPLFLKDPGFLARSICVAPSEYWQNRYMIDGKSHSKNPSPGQDSAESILINAFAPFFFFYAQKTGKEVYITHALEMLAHCKFENNVKTRLFASKKPLLQNAANSQGLLHLYNTYCSVKACLKCGVAASILQAPVSQNV